jgi:hypothetical protein
MAYCVAEASLRSGMIEMALLIEDSRGTREFLVEVCFVGLSMVHNPNHLWVVETQMIWATSHDRAFNKKH